CRRQAIVAGALRCGHPAHGASAGAFRAAHRDPRVSNHRGGFREWLPDPGTGKMNDTADDKTRRSSDNETQGGAISTAEVVPVVPRRGAVVFPGMMRPLAIGREASVAAARAAIKAERPIALLLQRDKQKDEPEADDLHRIGTLANPLRFLTAPDGSHHLVCQGVVRFRALNFERNRDHLTVYAERLNDPTDDAGRELEAQTLALRQQA